MALYWKLYLRQILLGVLREDGSGSKECIKTFNKKESACMTEKCMKKTKLCVAETLEIQSGIKNFSDWCCRLVKTCLEPITIL